MSETKLLPCPFCGGEANLYRVGDKQKVFNIQCYGCNADIDAWDTEDATIARWNARHDSAELADLRTKLAYVRKTLVMITEPSGAYSRDPLKFAENTIKSVSDLATKALAIIDAEPSA